jgi:hypothetical protein
MKRKTVTKSLKKTFKKLGIKHQGCFSDTRKNKQAVGVKFIGMDLTAEEITRVVIKMQKKGYEFIRVTPMNKDHECSYYNVFSGTRLTFYKKEYSFGGVK